MTNEPVVIAYNGSHHCNLALHWAVEWAALLKRPLVAVVADPTPLRHSGAAGWDEETMDRVRARAEEELRDVPDTTVEMHKGPVMAVLLAAAARATLIVVGSRGHGQVAGTLIGSVSQHLARHAACPVVVVRPAAQPAPSRIVVGVDGSGGCADALEFACRRAELTGEPVVAVHGWRLGNVPVDKHGDVPATLVTRMADQERLLAKSIDGLAEKFPDVELRTESIPVVAGHALADASITASLVVVGSRGRGAFEGLLLGSVSQYVLQHAHCPVAIVR
jgi:nucleotide-binding universal stress UspA family protein